MLGLLTTRGYRVAHAMLFIVQVPSSTNALGLSFVIIALFTKLYCKPKILVTCSRRLENLAGLRLSPSLPLFFVSGILVMQMRGDQPTLI